MGDNIVELNPNPFKFRRMRVNPHEVIVIQGRVILNPHLYNGIYIATFLDLAIRAACIAHQGSPSELKEAHMVGMIDDL